LKRIMDFIVSRFARLYPVYWFSVITNVFIVYVANFGTPRSEDLFDVAINFSMLQGFLGSPNINIVYWTMTLQLAFYAVMLTFYRMRLLKYIDLICGAWLCLIVLDTVKGSISVNFGAIAPTLEVASYNINAMSLIHSHQLGSFDIGGMSEMLIFLKNYIKINFVLIRGRASLFIAGIMLFQGQRFGFSFYRVGMILVCLITEAFDYSSDTPWYAFLFFAFFVIIIYLSITDKLGILEKQPLIFLGSISYSLYLTHIQTGWLLNFFLKPLNLPSGFLTIFKTMVAILVATLIAKKLEQPAMNWIRKWYKKAFA
ncbi:MAG: acyltransferase family protein, partial [Spirulina sp.]